MAVPKRRVSKTRGRLRRTHFTAAKATVVRCPQCDEPKQPHRACRQCGTYRRRQVIEVGSE